MSRIFASARRQGGFTLIELVIATALMALVMGVLASIILTSVRSTDVASSRVEASAQVRSFQSFAYDDFTAGQIQNADVCTAGSPCTSAIVVVGTRVSNAAQPEAIPYQITYTWDGRSLVDRQIGSGGPTKHAASNVTAFSWYVESPNGSFATLVVSITVKVSAYSESQTFRFYPRLNP